MEGRQDDKFNHWPLANGELEVQEGNEPWCWSYWWWAQGGWVEFRVILMHPRPDRTASWILSLIVLLRNLGESGECRTITRPSPWCWKSDLHLRDHSVYNSFILFIAWCDQFLFNLPPEITTDSSKDTLYSQALPGQTTAPVGSHQNKILHEQKRSMNRQNAIPVSSDKQMLKGCTRGKETYKYLMAIIASTKLIGRSQSATAKALAMHRTNSNLFPSTKYGPRSPFRSDPWDQSLKKALHTTVYVAHTYPLHTKIKIKSKQMTTNYQKTIITLPSNSKLPQQPCCYSVPQLGLFNEICNCLWTQMWCFSLANSNF